MYLRWCEILAAVAIGLGSSAVLLLAVVELLAEPGLVAVHRQHNQLRATWQQLPGLDGACATLRHVAPVCENAILVVRQGARIERARFVNCTLVVAASMWPHFFNLVEIADSCFEGAYTVTIDDVFARLRDAASAPLVLTSVINVFEGGLVCRRCEFARSESMREHAVCVKRSAGFLFSHNYPSRLYPRTWCSLIDCRMSDASRNGSAVDMADIDHWMTEVDEYSFNPLQPNVRSGATYVWTTQLVGAVQANGSAALAQYNGRVLTEPLHSLLGLRRLVDAAVFAVNNRPEPLDSRQ
jgi:hypothetical protein